MFSARSQRAQMFSPNTGLLLHPNRWLQALRGHNPIEAERWRRVFCLVPAACLLAAEGLH